MGGNGGAKEDARQECTLIFQAEVAMAGGLAAEVADLALDPDFAQSGLQDGADRASEVCDGPDARGLGFGLGRGLLGRR